MDEWTKNEWEYFKNQNIESEYPNLERTLREPRFTIADLNINAYDATYWDKKGILPDISKKGIRKYNLSQAIWIKFIEQMREMNIGLQTIKPFKDKIFTRSLNAEELLENPETKEVVMEYLKSTSGLSLEEFLADKGALDYINDNMFIAFEMAILTTIVLKQPIVFIVNFEGDHFVYNVHKHNYILEKVPDIADILSSPHFVVSISEAYQSLVSDWCTEDFFSELSLISSGEQRVLDAIRMENIEAVNIKKENGNLTLIETTKSLGDVHNKKVSELFASNAFETVTLKTQNGRIVVSEKLSKKKI
tara:strand:+ start:31667 stop:32581 length:915 start_codon:yes stop_codon:yes gene_type:complete